MRSVRIQSVDQRRPLKNDSNPRMAMAVDSPLMALRQTKPALQVEIVRDLFILAIADEKPREEADHHHGHAVANRVLGLFESIDQFLELLLTLGAISGSR